MASPEPPAHDRRSSTRRACRLQVRYRLAEPWHPATAVDLSESGCRLRVGEDLPRGATIEVAFALPAGGEGGEVRASGRVTWCRIEGLSRQVGVHFAAPAPVDALLVALP